MPLVPSLAGTDKTGVGSIPAGSWVLMGTTVGMLAANRPVIMASRWLMERMPMALVLPGASVLFFVLATVTLWPALGSLTH